MIIFVLCYLAVVVLSLVCTAKRFVEETKSITHTIDDVADYYSVWVRSAIQWVLLASLLIIVTCYVFDLLENRK